MLKGVAIIIANIWAIALVVILEQQIVAGAMTALWLGIFIWAVIWQ